jgi:hypothetical protein
MLTLLLVLLLLVVLHGAARVHSSLQLAALLPQLLQLAPLSLHLLHELL